MRHLIFIFSLSFFLSISAQSAQEVEAGHHSQYRRIIIDETNGDFFIEGYHSRNHEFDGLLRAYNADGQLQWDEWNNNYTLYNSNPDASRLIQLNTDTLAYLSLQGQFCEAPAYTFSGLLNKQDGAAMLHLFVGQLPDEYPGPYDQIEYTTSPTGNIIFRHQAALFSLPFGTGQNPSGYLFDVISDQEPVFYGEDSIVYLVPDGGIPFSARIQSLADQGYVEISLPLIFGGDRVLAVGNRLIIYAPEGGLYSLDPQTDSYRVFDDATFTSYKIKDDRVLFHDTIQHHYFWYYAAADSIGPIQSYDHRQLIINDLDFHNGQFYLAGSHTFSGDDRLKPYGFWYRGQGDSVAISSEDQLELINFTLDSVIDYEVVVEPQPDVPNVGYAAARIAFSIEVANRGDNPISEFSFSIPGSIFSGCAGAWDNINTFTPTSFPPGSSQVFNGNIWIYRDIPDDGSPTEVSLYGCVGRPNGKLELTYDDNCAVSSTLLVSNTAEPRQLATYPLKVSPNPSTGLFSISELPHNATQWRVFDLNGRQVQQGTLAPSQTQLQLSTLPAGVYILRIQGAEAVYQARLVKE